MDEQIKRKEELITFLHQKYQNQSLKQSDIVDTFQEFNRADHIMNHMIRASRNPAAHYLGFAVGATAGLALSHYYVRHYTLRNIGFIAASTAVAGVLGTAFFGSFFGDRKECKRLKGLKANSKGVDDRFNELIHEISKNKRF